MTFVLLRSTVAVHVDKTVWKYKPLLLLTTYTLRKAKPAAFLSVPLIPVFILVGMRSPAFCNQLVLPAGS